MSGSCFTKKWQNSWNVLQTFQNPAADSSFGGLLHLVVGGGLLAQIGGLLAQPTGSHLVTATDRVTTSETGRQCLLPTT